MRCLQFGSAAGSRDCRNVQSTASLFAEFSGFRTFRTRLLFVHVFGHVLVHADRQDERNDVQKHVVHEPGRPQIPRVVDGLIDQPHEYHVNYGTRRDYDEHRGHSGDLSLAYSHFAALGRDRSAQSNQGFDRNDAVERGRVSLVTQFQSQPNHETGHERVVVGQIGDGHGTSDGHGQISKADGTKHPKFAGNQFWSAQMHFDGIHKRKAEQVDRREDECRSDGGENGAHSVR